MCMLGSVGASSQGEHAKKRARRVAIFDPYLGHLVPESGRSSSELTTLVSTEHAAAE
jgi:hypothetical protein